MRRKKLRQNLHEERGINATQTDTQRFKAISLHALRKTFRKERPSQEALENTLPTQRDVRRPDHATFRRRLDVNSCLPVPSNVWILKKG